MRCFKTLEQGLLLLDPNISQNDNLICLRMIWRGLRATSHNHAHRYGAGFGFVAGLIPCQLALFGMIYATARGVPALDLVFAVLMLAGVAATLSAMAIATTTFRAAFNRAFKEKENCLARVSKVLEIAAASPLPDSDAS